MIFVKKLAGFAAAVLLTLSALAGSRVFADSDFVEVSVPITTVWLDPLFIDDPDIEVTSKFTLRPLNDDSPAPENIDLTITGAGRGTIGPIRFDSPGNFYYELTGVLGAKKQPVDMTIRISIFIEDGELIPVVTAYDNLKDPDLGEKSELVFKIEASASTGTEGDPSDKKDPPEKQEPDSKKPDGNPTPDNKGTRPADNSQNNQPGKNQGVHTGAQSYAEFWMLMGACALLAGLFLAKKGSRA